MPSERRNSGLRTKKHPTKPYDLEARTVNKIPYPPLPPGEETMLDFLREIIEEKYPGFIPRSSVDLLVMSSPGYDGPTDQESIYKHIDERIHFRPIGRQNHSVQDSDVIQSDYVDATVGRTRASDAIGAKPRPRQKVWTQVMPSWPEYSIRLWVSSTAFRLFGMDFVESTTDTPVNLSHRFSLYETDSDIFGDYEPILPFNDMASWTRTLPIGPGEELYNTREEQFIVIQDTVDPMPTEVIPSQGEGSKVVQKTLLKFRVPRHPFDPPKPPGVKYDEIHWSIDN